MLAWAVPVHAQGVAGIVVDPQDRRVVGASVGLACSDRRQRTATDGEGRFTVRLEPGAGPCVLSVAAPGFIPAVSALQGSGPLVVRLALAPVAETVEVRALPGPAATGGVVLLTEELRTVSDDPREIVRFAKARAGPAAGHAIYVDGLPAAQLPAVSRMASLAVNTDPYSAEYSDPGLQRIDIVTLAPDRHWRVELGGTPPTVGGASALGDRSHSRSLGAGVGGPSPWARGAFSLHASMDTVESERAIVAAVPGEAMTTIDVAPSATSRRVVSFRFHQPLAASGALRIEGTRTGDRASNAGVGGEVLAEAGHARDGAATELRVMVSENWSRLSWRSQFLGDWSAYATRATNSAAGVQVQGAFVGGGAAIASSTNDRARWLWKSVAGSAAGRVPWRVGFTVERALQRTRQVPNPAGYLHLSSPKAWSAAAGGAATVTSYRVMGPTVQQVALLNFAAFADVAFLQRPRLRLNGGVRLDWQSHDDLRLSPRLSGAGRAGAWTVSGGAGLFTHAWRPELFLGTRAAEGRVPIQVMARQVSLADLADPAPAGEPVVMDIVPGLTRARYLMTSLAADRPVGRLTVGVGHVWWHGRHLLGAERLASQAGSGWTDWLESNRRFDSHQVSVRIEVGGRNRNASVHYGWMHSTDDTDGPWAFPARQGDLAAERAASARIAAHNLDLVTSLLLPRGVRVTATASLRGASPYNIVSGQDAEGNGLYTDRGGRPRNSGRLHGPRSVAVYVHRRFTLSSVFGPRIDVPVDGGVQFDNLLDGRSWTMVGNVAGSPLFGRPEGAMPGRSVRIWFALAR
jgi:hypothetical protein